MRHVAYAVPRLTACAILAFASAATAQNQHAGRSLPARAVMQSLPSQSATKVLAQPVPMPPTAPAKPFVMRGVQLGISLDEFKAFPLFTDNGETNPHVVCGDDSSLPNMAGIQSSGDKAIGIVACEWLGDQGEFRSQLFIDIGGGKGPPVFDFIDDGGVNRLFRIRFFANSEYSAAILDALTRGYGPPKEAVKPFRTLSGAKFESHQWVWDNGVSSIALTEPCQQLERYCLVYRHARLGQIYDALVEQRAAAAATKL